MWEAVDKDGGPCNTEKMGRHGMVWGLENSTRDGVKGGGVGDLRKDGSEEFEATIDAIIRIQRPYLSTKNQ